MLVSGENRTHNLQLHRQGLLPTEQPGLTKVFLVPVKRRTSRCLIHNICYFIFQPIPHILCTYSTVRTTRSAHTRLTWWVASPFLEFALFRTNLGMHRLGGRSHPHCNTFSKLNCSLLHWQESRRLCSWNRNNSLWPQGRGVDGIPFIDPTLISKKMSILLALGLI